jgi:tRNA/rRNA methyltransferase
LLAEVHRDRLDVVLVRPRNPLNIGAAARAMANFGFERLAVVAPYEPHWQEAKSAIGADDLLQNAKSTECLAEAVADCTLVIGTGSLTRRKPEQPAIPLPALAPLVGRELARGGRVALVFGSEKRGLSREDLSYCHLLVEIPTEVRQPSMNLGQAVAVCLYELASRRPGTAPESEGREPPATAEELERLAGVVDEAMEAARYSPAAMREANRHDLRLMLRRLAPSRRDASRILGIFRRMIWQMKKAQRRKTL